MSVHLTNAERCDRCTCCTAHLCGAAIVNRKACVDNALVWTAEMLARTAVCPCAPEGKTYPPLSTDNVIPFPGTVVSR